MFPVPVNENVIIKADAEEVSPAGIIIEGSNTLPTTGVVYGVSEDCWLPTGARTKLTTMDRVLFQKGAGVKFDYENEQYYIMESKHILAVI